MAAAYARDRAAAGWPLVAWVAAETQDQLLKGLADVAMAAGVADADGDSVVSAENVRRYLEMSRTPGLVVFDNATDIDGLAPFLPAVGPVQVVITSRDRAFTRLGAAVEVGLFTPEQSVAYLSARTGLADIDGAARVAAELGYLPLALAQAATVIGHRGWDYATYQQRLHSAPAATYLGRQAGDPYPRGVVEAITLAICSSEDQDDTGLVRMVTRLLSVLSAEGVSRSLLASLAAVAIADPPPLPPHTLDEAIEEALGQLASGSILTRSESGQTFTMHRLVSRVVREREEAAGRLLPALLLAADGLRAHQVPEAEAWLHRETGSQLVEQVSAIWAVFSTLDQSEDQGFGVLAERLFSLRNWSVRQLTDAADLSRATSLGAKVLAECERVLGPDHPETLMSRSNLAGAYLSAGRLREAISLCERSLADSERVLGPDHPQTLMSRSNLAGAYLSAGRLREAISLCEPSLADSERVLGPDHPGTLTSRNNLARAYRSAGRLREAIGLCEPSLADREGVLSLDHLGTLTSRSLLAGAYLSAGQVRDAISLCEPSLADFERVLGRDHPDTLASRTLLAVAYLSAGQVRDATSLCERSLADRERVLGPDHPDTLASRANLAVAYLSTDRLRGAISLCERSLADFERVLGPGHLDTLTCRSLLAMAYLSAGRLRVAISLCERSLADFERVLGPGHLDTLTCRSNLASAYRSAGRLREAISLYERNLADFERVLGPGHLDTLTCRSNLAGAYRSAGRLREAISLYERNLADSERVLGPGHLDTLTFRHNLTVAYLSAGRLNRAIALYWQNSKMVKRVLEAGHPYWRTYRRFGLLLFIDAVLVSWLVWSNRAVGVYYDIRFLAGWLAFILISRMLRRFLTARGLKFFSYSWYGRLKYCLSLVTGPRNKGPWGRRTIVKRAVSSPR